MKTDTLVFIIEIIGTIAFASSGAMVGIRRKMDLFGVIVMAVTTAVGGGIIRDLVLGVEPPSTFKNAVYVEYAVGTAVVLFIAVYLNRQVLESHFMALYEKVMLFMDAAGLGAFTVIGIHAGIVNGYEDHKFLLLFVGVVTGVGGGMLRDVMAMQMPFIFVKHVYACASLAGAVICLILIPQNMSAAMVSGAIVVVIIRMLAAKYKWNLPKIDLEAEAK